MVYRKIKETEEHKEKEEAVDLLRKQIAVEGELVALYERATNEIKSIAVKRLLHMIQLDSRKHIDVCQFAIELLQGEDMLSEEKTELLVGLQSHISLEEDSVDRMNNLLKNPWIKETKGLKELINRLKKDEQEHHKSLVKLTKKEFFREDPYELLGDFIDREARYRRFRKRLGRS